MSARQVAERFGVAPAAMYRHLQNGHVVRKAVVRDLNRREAVGALAQAAAEAPQSAPQVPVASTDSPPDAATLSARQRLVAVAQKLEARAAQSGMRSDIARELRLTYAELDRLDAGNGPTEVRVKDVEGLPELLGDLFKALEPFPDARRAMGAVLDKHGVF